MPVKRGALTCELFRHKRGDELFEVNVLFPDDGDVTGAVRCTVEAENLTKPVELLTPVSRTIETYSLAATAEALVERCCRGEWRINDVPLDFVEQSPRRSSGGSAFDNLRLRPVCLLSHCFAREQTVKFREEFRAPRGVRKSPRKEPAGSRPRSMGI